ncbi:hypothetical protein FHU36_000288 [Nonomuraea muscovyensis]|uniref:Uncharacterized protein n=1 Tax=Nonomuraea muscovyensis TaxID=1124761 RepID=A0A7X0BVQ7_9ACTN|nr:hypothetical protein [Nonomuraea muscovyensis]MBB6343779.1 hypothetical protein [Nonomuraea muscovyensis]
MATPARVELTLFSGPADAECSRCRDMYEIKAFAVFVDGDQWTCPPCADREARGIEQIIKGLDLVHEALLLDVFTRPITGADARAITWAIRALADLVDDVMADRVEVRLGVHIQEGVIPEEKGEYIGVLINHEITAIGGIR